MHMESAPPGAGRAAEIVDGIYAIDTGFQGIPEAVAAFLVVGPNGFGLIETGPTTVRDSLVAGIEDAGYSIDDVTQAIVTHIHLDHAGGLGSLLREHENMHGWVHPAGLPHVVDPARLLTSAARIYGDRMEMLWGDVPGAPEDRLSPMQDRTAIDVGGRKVVPFFTPGHASHHAALLDEQTGTLFTGDVAGARMQGTSFVVSPLPPPDIDLDAWRNSIELMRTIGPERLALTHFGAFSDVEVHLATIEESLDKVMAIGREVLPAGGSEEALTHRLEAWQRDGLGENADRVWASLDAANPLYMSAMGIHRILRKSGELES